MAEFKIAEKFISINGEGQRAGQLAVFIRFKGCNLCCEYCDTKWANLNDEKFTVMTEESIFDYIKQTGIKNVTLTGGEPLFQDDIYVLLEKLASDGFLNVEIETNGSLPVENIMCIKNRPSLTLDYKLSCSHMELYMYTDNYKYLDMRDTVKFVAGNLEDLDKTREIIKCYQLTQKCHVFISTVFGSLKLEDVVEYMKKYSMNDVNLQVQLHKIIWSPDKRGV